MKSHPKWRTRVRFTPPLSSPAVRLRSNYEITSSFRQKKKTDDSGGPLQSHSYTHQQNQRGHRDRRMREIATDSDSAVPREQTSEIRERERFSTLFRAVKVLLYFLFFIFY